MTDEKSRRRWISFGELIALAALAVSAAGVWIAWKANSKDEPTRVVEQRTSVPLALRGTVENDGRTLIVAPADPSHALQSLTVTIKGASSIEAGSDGRISARDIESALKDGPKESKEAVQRVPVRINAHYVEGGADRRGGGNYVLRYKWEGGGLFGGRSLRLVGLSR
jgi:hypothetical protein